MMKKHQFGLMWLLFSGMLCAASTSVAQDTLPPMLIDFFRSPGAVDTTTGSQQVDVTLEVTDASGFASAALYLQSPSGSLLESTFFDVSNRASGDALHGIYRDVLTFDQHTESGIWEPYFQMEDHFGNRISLLGADLAALGFNLSVAVNVVPEPASIMLLATAAVGLLLRRRR